ncbi:MAG: hypothetical protein LBQ51_10745 [Desulfovibrio sp.]|jgi:hypothetical protein|nr:hypothetical protein [Desulfovibrio sp.]
MSRLESLLDDWRAEDATAGSIAPGPLAETPDAPAEDSGVRLAFEASSDITAQKVSYASELAKSLGWPEKIVIENPYRAEQERAARKVEEHPLLAKWAEEDRSRAALVREDPDGLSSVFGSVANLGAWAEKVTDSVESGIAGGVKSLLKTPARLPGIVGETVYEIGGMAGGALDFTESGIARGLQALGVPGVGKGTEFFASVRDWMLQQATNIREGYLGRDLLSLPEEKRGSLFEHPEYLLDPEWLVYQAGEAANSLAVMALGAGLAGGGKMTAAATGGLMEAGSFYQDMVQDGVANEQALPSALAFGGITGLLNKIGLDKILEGKAGQGLIRNIINSLMGGAFEGATEYAENPAQAIIEGIARGEAPEQILSRFFESLKDVDVIPGSLIVGAGVHAAATRRNAARAAEYAQRHVELHKLIESTKTKQLAPEYMQSALQAAGMNESVELPAADLLRLYQSGADILSPLDISEEKAAETAALGQSFTVRADLLHSVLDQPRFEAVAQIMRRLPDSMNAEEAVTVEDSIASDMSELVEALNAQAAHEDAVKTELARLEAESVAALKETDPLLPKGALSTLKQLGEDGGTPEAYAKRNVAAIVAFARRNYSNPDYQLAFLRRMKIQGAETAALEDSMRAAERAGRFAGTDSLDGHDFSLPPDAGHLPDFDELGDLYTPDEYEKMQADQAQMEAMGISGDMTEIQKARALNPWLEAIWGRLDGKSLGTTYPDAYKEITRIWGPGIFRSAERGGQPADVLADELMRENIFQQGMGADELVERLKRPRSDYLSLFQSAPPVESEAFMVWFGESKVVDADGKPLVVYHNTTGKFDRFDLSFARKGAEIPAFFFSPDRDSWADMGDRQIAVYLSIKNPFEGNYSNYKGIKGGSTDNAFTEIREALIRDGYDGIIMREDGEIVEYVAFSPTQIKSVNNRGTWNPNDPRILYQFAGEQSRMSEPVQANLKDKELRYLDKTKSAALGKHIPGHHFPSVITAQRSSGQKITWGKEVVKPDFTLNSPGPGGKPRGQDKGNLGYTRFTPDAYRIVLGKNANLSTLIHETGHVFEAELRRIVASGMADERQIADLAALDKWLARFNDDAELKAEYNKRIKKAYFNNGKAFEKLSAAEREKARDFAKREYFARGFEAYCREGKAPSEGLRGVFARFKKWLLAVYKDAKELGVEMNDDVRGVFDRMLAVEMEINEAAAVNELFAVDKALLEKLKVPAADRTFVSGLAEAAKQKALADVERERNRERTVRLREWYREARAELLKDPIYAARAELRKPGMHLNTAAVVDVLGAEAAELLRKRVGPLAVRQDGGQHPDVFAASHGFTDAAHMLAAITGVESMGKRTDDIVRAREFTHDAEVDPAPYLLRTQEAAKAVDAVGKWIASALGRIGISDRAFVETASKRLAAMPMRQAQAHLVYVGAMRRALKRMHGAVARGDFAVAFEAYIQARLNLEFSRQSLDIADAVKKLEKSAARFSGMKKADPVARFAVNVLASRYGIIRFDERLAGDKTLASIESWYKERYGEGYMMAFDADMYAGKNMPWRDMPFSGFKDVADEIGRIIVVERNMRQLLKAAGKAEYEATVDALNGNILNHHKQKDVKLMEKYGVFGKAWRTTIAWHTKMENLCRILDGGEPIGLAWTDLYKPINDAEDRRGQMWKALNERLRGSDMFGAYTEAELIEMSRRKERVDSINESITREQRIMFFLNLGNEGNRKRIERGFGYTERQIADIIQPLTERDCKFAQAVWDTFEQYKPEAFAMQERVTGSRPTEVEAKPFTFLTSDGKRMDMRGGYFPVMYDRAQADPKLSDDILQHLQPSFGAGTRKGHLQERTATGAGTPLSMDMTGIVRALDDVITDICFREAMIDVGRIIRNKSFRHTVTSTLGPEYYQIMVDWLKDSARTNYAPTPGQGIARWARTGATTMGMGIKMTTVMVQPVGLTQSIEQIGSGAVAQGMAQLYGHGRGIQGIQEVVAEIRSLSPMMDTRMKSYDRDAYDATSVFAGEQLTPAGMLDAITPAGIRAFEKKLKKFAFVPMAGVQFYMVDAPTWLGAFNKYLKEHEGQTDAKDKAKDYADHIVRITQGTGLNKDLAKIQRGSEFLKLFTMFYSYFSTLFGLIQLRSYDVKQHGDKAAAMRAANSFLLLVAVPALLSEWVAGRGPDEDDEWWKWSVRILAMYPAQTVIGLRDLSQALDPKYGFSASPAQDTPASLYNLMAGILKVVADPEKFDAKKLGKLALRTYGYSKGLPMKQPEITLFNLIDYADGTSPDFELRDLAFTRQPSRR